MNPGYMRIKLSKKEAMERLRKWLNLSEFEPPAQVSLMESVEKACDENYDWKGIALFIYENSNWTVFQDLSGYLASFTAQQWLEYAQNDELVLAGYNDSVPYGQLIVLQDSGVIREFLDDKQDPNDNINKGQLEIEKTKPISSWVDAATFVDEDELGYEPDDGVLWILKKRS